MRWTDDELHTLEEMIGHGRTCREVAEVLGRTVSATRTQLRQMHEQDNEALVSAELARKGDGRFRIAMRSAIADGREHARLGTVRAPGDVRTTARFVPAGCAMSINGSPAALCAALGVGE